MGCSPSAYPPTRDRATDPLAAAAGLDGAKPSRGYSSVRSSCSPSEDQDNSLNSSLSSSSEHRRRRRNSLGKKSSSRERRGSWEHKAAITRQRSSDETKDKQRSNQDMKRKDTPAAFSAGPPPGVKSAVSQLTSSQIDFFRMLDEKIAQGRDYDSENELGVSSHAGSAAVDIMYKNDSRTPQVSS